MMIVITPALSEVSFSKNIKHAKRYPILNFPFICKNEIIASPDRRHCKDLVISNSTLLNSSSLYTRTSAGISYTSKIDRVWVNTSAKSSYPSGHPGLPIPYRWDTWRSYERWEFAYLDISAVLACWIRIHVCYYHYCWWGHYPHQHINKHWIFQMLRFSLNLRTLVIRCHSESSVYSALREETSVLEYLDCYQDLIESSSPLRYGS